MKVLKIVLSSNLLLCIVQVGDGHARIGLNLGVRTYFSTEDTATGRLGKRHRAGSPGSQVPMCQAEGCKADLSTAKHYHRRHKVCEFHSKAPTVIVGAHTQRFCQQCSRYGSLSKIILTLRFSVFHVFALKYKISLIQLLQVPNLLIIIVKIN
jgi:hypothetical protein